MKAKKCVNKILTAALSASMLIGSTMPVLATDGEVDVEAPIYSLDIINVIVPTSYAVAFNPDGLEVKTGTSTTSDAQILSKNYGIINKSSKDKVITVKLNIEDQNTNSGITFVDSEDDITAATDSEYKIHLTAIPADTTEVQVAGAKADQKTAATALNDVTMTKATGDGTAVTLKSGDNYIGFKLSKAVWTAKKGSELTLGTTNSNDVSANFEVTGLAADGSGITAFTFGGEMNQKADWSKLTQGIKISVVYDSENAPSDLAPISGTGAMTAATLAPKFSTGKGVGQINYSLGVGDSGLKQIQKITTIYNGNAIDGYHANGSKWTAATDKDGVITLSSKFMGYSKDVAMAKATVTYVTNGGETKTASVDVKCVGDAAPVFTTGSGVGQINYTMGVGDLGLKEIQKVAVIINSSSLDVYHANGTKWSAATDKDGVITLDSKVITTYLKDVATAEATVTYVSVSGETQTATVDILCQ